MLSVSRMTAAWCMMAWMLQTMLNVPLLEAAVNVIQPYKVVSTNGTAKIQCFMQPHSFNYQSPTSSPRPEEFRITLLRGLHGREELCSSMLNFTEERERLVDSEEVHCYAQVKGGTVDVTVSGLRSADTDIYRCQLEVYYPPPYLHITGNGTLIHVINCPVPEPQRLHIHQSDEDDDGDDGRMEPPSLPVAILVVLVILVLAIIVYIQCGHNGRSSVTAVPDMWHKTDAAALSCGKVV